MRDEVEGHHTFLGKVFFFKVSTRGGIDRVGLAGEGGECVTVLGGERWKIFFFDVVGQSVD